MSEEVNVEWVKGLKRGRHRLIKSMNKNWEVGMSTIFREPVRRQGPEGLVGKW